MSYFKNVMGKEWGEAQVAKPRDEWHPLFAWYAMTCEYQKKLIANPGQPTSLPMTGAACGIMWLTYGLYLLRHNAEIQSRLLQRLRTPDPVQVFGALHEVIIAAAMILKEQTIRVGPCSKGSKSLVLRATLRSRLSESSLNLKMSTLIRPGLLRH